MTGRTFMSESAIPILMYHSISEGTGPACIAPRTFREQMALVFDHGYQVVSLVELAAWRRGECKLPPRSLAITFDDGFEDFADVAFPELEKRGWRSTVFLPAGKLGGTDNWEKGLSARRLIGWSAVEKLARLGVDFGAHGVTHRTLTSLPAKTMRDEVAESKRMIEERTGSRVTGFAPPYGKTNDNLRSEIQKRYLLAVGTTMDPVRDTSDLFDLPRIEMWYFRNLRRWSEYLEKESSAYFQLRRGLRKLRALAFR